MFGPLFFLIYTNNFSNIIADALKSDLFADDTRIIIVYTNPSTIKVNINN